MKKGTKRYILNYFIIFFLIIFLFINIIIANNKIKKLQTQINEILFEQQYLEFAWEDNLKQ